MGSQPPKRWNLAEAKARLSVLVQRASQGEEIVIALRGVPRARLVPIEATARRKLRVPGKGKGRFRIGADFNDPLPPEVLAAFLAADADA